METTRNVNRNEEVEVIYHFVTYFRKVFNSATFIN